MRPSCLLLSSLGLTGCAPMLAVIGYPSSVVQVVTQVERVKMFGDGASYVTSSKTITDHVMSKVMDKDCKVFNVVTREPVCVEKNPAPNVAAAPAPALPSPPQPAMSADAESVMTNLILPFALSHAVTED